MSPCNENLTQHVSLSHWCQIHQFGFSNCMYCCTTICLSMPVWCTCTINYLCLSIYLLYLICVSFCLLYFIYQSAVFHLHIILSFVFHLSIIVVFSSVYHCVCCIFHLSLCLLYFIYHCNSCIFHLSIIVTVVYLSVYHCVCFIFIFLSLQPSCTYICLILHDLEF